MISREKLIERAQTGLRENKNLDFKSEFDPTQPGDWCEIIKDIVAFANSGGGVIVIGINDDLSPSNFNIQTILNIDPADVTNKIEKYTGFQYSDFEFIQVQRNDINVATIIIRAAKTPMVFQKPGTYAIADNKQKNAFAKGTVYFRHGSKSEPANMEDLRDWCHRELELARAAWLDGIRQVVEAPAGQTVQIVSSTSAEPEIIHARIGHNPDAIIVRPENPMEVWPHRQIELLNLANEQMLDGVQINGYDIQSIKSQHNITPISRPDFVLRSHNNAAPQYSDAFVQWIVGSYNEDNNFFTTARQFVRENR